MRTRIVKIGNSQGVRIPKQLLEESGIDTEVDLIMEKNQLILKAVKNPREGWDDAFASDTLVRIEDGLHEYKNIQNQWDEEEWQW